MRITRLEADGFKNLCEIALEPDASYNLILGENAQGRRYAAGGGKVSGC